MKGSDELDFGYIIPGHGFEGKQHLINDSANLRLMYDSYKKGPIIE